MLTRAQMDRAVVAVTKALTAYCSCRVAEERARNLVTALMFPLHPIERRDAVKAALDVPAIKARDYWAAVRAADEAFCGAIKCTVCGGSGRVWVDSYGREEDEYEDVECRWCKVIKEGDDE